MREKQRLQTAIKVDLVRPTESQIQHGVLVIPKPFIDQHRTVSWHSFRARLNGESLGVKKIDQDNRMRLPLKTILRYGDALQLSVHNEELLLERVEAEKIVL